MATETMHREVDKKENYFSVQVQEGEEMKIFLDGVEVVCLLVPYEGTMRVYMAREKASIQYK